ncbi:Cytochrome P450 monooygenase 3 [Colletotrichum sp. SAR 10_98]|nr:Cytochrome P450 monooygenase 3 [Colletotrichum sp. SAR 10_98]
MLWQLWAPVVFATAVLGLYRLWKKLTTRLNFPIVGSPGDQNMAYAVLEGHQKYPDTPFIVPADPPRVILPMTLYQEVIHAAESEFSFGAELYDVFLGKYTHIGVDNPDVIGAVRVDLTRNLNGVLQPIQDEVRHGMEQLVGSSTEWQTFNLHKTILRMVGLMSGRVFVGLPLSRDEEWLAASINFTVDVAKSRVAMLRLHPLIRPFFLRFLPEVQHMLREQKRAQEWMKPLVSDFVQNEFNLEEKAKPGSRGAFISWMMKYLPQERRTAEAVGNNQMLLSFAAIHTTSSTTTFAVMDLLGHPEYIQPLREEIQQVIAEDGYQQDETGKNYLSKTSLNKLKKLDSFIKESQRETKNAPPAEFDGFRFSRLREIPGREMKHQAATTGPDAFNFGHGPHSCPGRFFAVYMIKCILVELLMDYDMQLKSTGTGPLRPANIVKQTLVMPDSRIDVEIKRRVQI